MKKLLNTLYIINPDQYLSLDGENVVVKLGGETVGRAPLHNLDGIVTFGYTGASPRLMEACAEYNITLTFLSTSGKFLARVVGETKGNVVLRKSQYQKSEDELESLNIAKSCILGKVFNCRWVLERAARDHSLQIDCEKVRHASGLLKNSLDYIKQSSSLDELRGFEGEAASIYFSVFDELILQQKSDFVFNGRNRRPPLDAVNALLSFVYTLLTGMVQSSLESVGLDPYVGFLHRDRPGRASLALDMMEELRPVLADRFVLSLINKRMVSIKGFYKKESGAVVMDDATKKTVIQEWQNRKKDEIKHPFLDEKLQWGMVPHAQALLLSRYIRNDTDAYPPFFWK